MRIVFLLMSVMTFTTTDAFVVTPQQQQQSVSFSSVLLQAKKKVFIDGEAGTTGIQVRDRLAQRDDLEIISAPNELRKDVATRKQLINEADAVILCTYLYPF